MGDIIYRQTLTISAAKNPVTPGAPIIEKDFELSPAEILDVSDTNESVSSRFVLPTGITDQSIGMGSVAAGKLLVIKADSDLKIKLVNANGISQLITIKGGRTSVLHADFTDVKMTNDSAAVIKGKVLVLGD